MAQMIQLSASVDTRPGWHIRLPFLPWIKSRARETSRVVLGRRVCFNSSSPTMTGRNRCTPFVPRHPLHGSAIARYRHPGRSGPGSERL